MSNFKETFTRTEGQESNLQYDDTAFKYFFLSILCAIAVPIFILILKPIFSNPAKKKYSNSCTCTDCKEKFVKLYKNDKYNFITKGYIFKIVVFILILYIFNETYNSINIQTNMKSFDPYEILEIEPGADDKAIKKAYRRLTLKYHPDKNPDDPKATAKFILIAKAYECLADEKKKHLCEKFGNPDGPGSFQIAIAMPSFLLKKENHVAVLAIFFIIFIVIIPVMIYYCFLESNNYDENGTSYGNYKNYLEILNENMIIKKCPEILGVSIEYSKLKCQSRQEDKELESLRRAVIDNLQQNQKKKYLPYIQKAIVLINAHLNSEKIHQCLEQDYNEILYWAPGLIQTMINLCHQSYWQSRRMNKLKGMRQDTFQTKFLGSQCLSTLVNFQQMMIQGQSSKEQALFQLSYFQKFAYERRNKKLPTIQELINQTREQRKITFVTDEQQKDEVNNELDLFPKVSISYDITVEDEKVITNQDLIQFQMKLIRDNQPENTQWHSVHALRYPFQKEEKWHIFISNETNELFFYKLISGKQKIQEIKWQFQIDQIGLQKLYLHVMPDCYLGLDIEREIIFQVDDINKVKREVVINEEDQKLFNYQSPLTQLLNYNQNDSDEEEEEEEDNNKNKKQNKNSKEINLDDKNQKKNNNEGDQEEEEEEEEDTEEQKKQQDQNNDDNNNNDEIKQ